eukprot:jgi/Bigna1/86571/estExt_fgenesh1_pg.C_110242
MVSLCSQFRRLVRTAAIDEEGNTRCATSEFHELLLAPGIVPEKGKFGVVARQERLTECSFLPLSSTICRIHVGDYERSAGPVGCIHATTRARFLWCSLMIMQPTAMNDHKESHPGEMESSNKSSILARELKHSNPHSTSNHMLSPTDNPSQTAMKTVLSDDLSSEKSSGDPLNKDLSPLSYTMAFKGMKHLLIPSFLEGFVSSASRLIYFVFLRTTIDCEEETPPDFDRTSVAREAQFLKGITDGVEAALKFFIFPFLGLLSDVKGRNATMTLSVIATAAYRRRGSSILPLITIAYIVQDSYWLQIFRIFTQGVAVLFITGFVITANHYEYFRVYLSLCIISLVTVPLPYMLIPESNQDPNLNTSWRDATPYAILSQITESPYLSYFAVAVFISIIGLSVLSISVAFVIAAYKWTQTVAVIVAIGIGAGGFFTQAAAPRLIDLFGARRVLLMAINSSNIGLIIMVFSPISPAFFIIGLAFVVSAIIGIPAFLSLVSRQVYAHLALFHLV